jgi:hypothetical protein
MNLKIGLALALILGALGWVQEEKCEWKIMRALHGPEDAVYFRGSAVLGKGKVVISLPAGFETFAKPGTSTVQLTCLEGYSPLFVSKVDQGQFMVSTTDTGSPSQAFFWELKAACATVPGIGSR